MSESANGAFDPRTAAVISGGYGGWVVVARKRNARIEDGWIAVSRPYASKDSAETFARLMRKESEKV